MVRKNVGRLLIVAAGTGCLVVLFFVVLPMMDEPAPPTTQDEIVAQVLGSGETASDDGEIEAVTPVPSPLVGVRNDGEELAVIFQAAELEAEGLQVAAAESPVDDSGLLQALSADDVAAARAALERSEVAPVEDLVAKMAEGTEAARADVRVPVGPEAPAAAEAVRVSEVNRAEAKSSVMPASGAEETEQVGAPLEPAKVEGVVLPAESVPPKGTGMRNMVEAPGVRRVEFDLPVSLDSRTPLEVSHPSRGVPTFGAAEAVQSGVIVPGTLRGVMGYRLPLVSRQEVPDQIVSGVLIPAHTTFVILKKGSWELVDVTPEELERLREAATGAAAPATEVESARKGWNPLRIFRKR